MTSYNREVQAGSWTEEPETEKLLKVKTLLKQLAIPTYFATMGASNGIFVQGRLPQGREKMVKALENALACTGEPALQRYQGNLQHL